MADWRQRGYVPDSDDEGEDHDDLTGLSTALRSSNSQREANDVDTSTQQPIIGVPNTDVNVNDKDNESNIIPSRSIAEDLEAILNHGLTTIREVLSSAPSPTNPGEQDDSPLSSPPSSIANSPSLPANDQQLSEIPPIVIADDQPLDLTENDVAAWAHRRSLRTRAPIQLHPYMLEDAKYRELMRTRGVKPVHLQQPSCDSKPSAEESQMTDLFRSSQAEETQSQRARSPLVASEHTHDDESQSPVRGSRLNTKTDRQYLQVDELPDLDQILKDRVHPQKKVYKPRRTSKPKSDRLLARGDVFDMPSDDDVSQTRAIKRIGSFQVPPSPPRSTGIDMSDDILMLSDQDDSGANQTPNKLPTPLVSSDNFNRKRQHLVIESVDISSVESEEDSESSDQEVSRDDSQGVQQIGRRIRGVLPVSWLKLDMKKQSWPRDGKQVKAASSKTANDKGVAHRHPVKKTNQHRPQRSIIGVSDLADSESDDVQDGHDEILDVQQDKAALGTYNNLLMGDIEQEDSIDAMLPSVPRRRSLSVSKPRTQRIASLNWPSTRPQNQAGEDFSLTSRSPARRQSHKGHRRRRKKTKTSRISNLVSVLEAPGLKDTSRSEQPRFLKIAVRQARNASKDVGLPVSEKVFYLATKDDTNELLSELRQWRMNQDGYLRDPAKNVDNESRLAHDAAVAMPTSHQRHQGAAATALDESAADLAMLKTSTGALLKRIAPHSNSDKSGPINKGRNTNENLRTSDQPGNATIQLRSLFPYRNRAGRGIYLSKDTVARPAQIESEAIKSSIVLSPPPHRVPSRKILEPQEFKHIPCNNSPANIPVADTVLAAKETAKRKSRKQLPRRWTQPKDVLDETPVTEDIEADDAIHVDMTEFARRSAARAAIPNGMNVSAAVLHQLRATASHLQEFHKFSVHTRFLGGLVGQGILSRAVTRSQDQDWYWRQPDAAVTLLRMPTIGLSHNLGVYDDAAKSVVKRCHARLLQTLLHETFFVSAPDAHDCLRGLRGIVEWVNESISFDNTETTCVADDPVEILQNSSLESLEETLELERDAAVKPDNEGASTKYHFLTVSMALIRNALQCIEANQLLPNDNPDDPYGYIFKIHNWLTLHAFQLHTIAHDIEPLQQQTRDLCEVLICSALRSMLQFDRLTGFYLREIRQFHNQLSTTATHTFGPGSPAAAFILIACHVCKRLSADGSLSLFYQLVERCVEKDPQGRNPVRDACTALLTIAYVVRFTDLGTDGRLLTANMHQNDLRTIASPWTFIAPFISRMLDAFKLVPEVFQRMVEDGGFLKAVVLFLFALSTEWQWAPTPVLLSVMLKLYSYNDMRSYTMNEQDRAIYVSFEPISAAHETDYDRFLNLVRAAIKLHQSANNNEQGSRSANTAARLRDFVFSLFPNNAQLYDLQDELQVKQFVGLKNHFALYLALYKSAPNGCRPRIEQLSGQVNLEQSHSMVCSLAIRVWEVVCWHEFQQGNSAPRVLEEIGSWLDNMLNQLIMRQQRGERNEDDYNTQDLLFEIFGAVEKCLDLGPSESDARALLQPAIATIRRIVLEYDSIGMDSLAMDTAIMALQSYVKLVLDGNEEGILIAEIQAIIQGVLPRCLGDTTETGLNLLRTATNAWFSVASVLVKSFRKNWEDYLSPYSRLSIEFMSGTRDSPGSEEAVRLFLSNVIESEQNAIFLEYRPLIFAHWVAALLVPIPGRQAAQLLTTRIARYGSESLDLTSLFSKIQIMSDTGDTSLPDVSQYRFAILSHIIETISGQQEDPESEWLAGGLDENDMRMILRRMMTTMKDTWLSFQADPATQNDYTPLVEAVLNMMEIYPFKGFVIDPWFTDGTGFPRSSQTFEAIFRCRFGEEGGDLAKSFVVTLRLQAVQAVRLHKRQLLTNELETALHCTDPLRVKHDEAGKASYSIDFVKQTQLLHLVFPVYIEQASTKEGAMLVLPFLECLTFITDNILYRIDNLNPQHMVSFIKATTSNLHAVKIALQRTQSSLTAATAPLLEYASVAIDTAWMLAFSEEIDIDEPLREALIASTMSLVICARSFLTGDEGEAMEKLAESIIHACNLEDKTVQLDEKETDTVNFARRDLGAALRELSSSREGFVDEGFEREEVERGARVLIALVEKLPLAPENDTDEDEDEWQ